MKKQFQILAATFITVAFISCSKEKIETPLANQNAEEVTGINKAGGNGINPLNFGLIARFEFNSNLKDTTGQLPNWTSTVDRVIYTTDRKGQANKAIRFNEAYGLNLFGVPVDTNMSISVWVKNEIGFFPDFAQVAFVTIGQGLSFYQIEDKYHAGSWNGISGQSVLSGPIDNKWHHLTATRDQVSLKFYIDGNLIGSSPTPAGSGPSYPLNDYHAGYGYNNGYKYWKGSMDDLRIYKRALTAVEANKLANL